MKLNTLPNIFIKVFKTSLFSINIFLIHQSEFLASYRLLKNFKLSNMTWLIYVFPPGKVSQTTFGGKPELFFFF